MKLHLPKLLRHAVLACIASVAGVTATVGTATVIGGAVAFILTQQAEAATYYLNAAAGDSTTISTSFRDTSGGTTSIAWQKFCSLQTNNYDGPHQLVIDQARTEGNKVKIDFAPFCVSGINVTSGATNNYLYRENKENNIVIGNGATDAAAQSSSFAEDFTLEHQGGGGCIELVGTQTWTITDDKTLSLNGQVKNTGTTIISGGTLSISTYDADSPGTLTNNGTLTVKGTSN